MRPSTTAVTDVTIQNKRKLLFRIKMLRDQLTNPIIKSEPIGHNLRGKYKVLWSKDYGMDELLNDRDEHHYQEVKIFKKIDQIKHFQEGASINNSANMDDPDIIKYDDFLANTTSVPLLSQQIFLCISANTTLSQQEDAVDFHTATYDINIKSKYTSNDRIA